MRQFDAYRNPSPSARLIAPYLVVLSSHHLRGLSEVIVAPSVNDAASVVDGLEIAVDVEGEHLTLVVSELFSMAASELRRPVANFE